MTKGIVLNKIELKIIKMRTFKCKNGWLTNGFKEIKSYLEIIIIKLKLRKRSLEMKWEDQVNKNYLKMINI